MKDGKRKRLIVPLTVGFVLVGAVAAYAYFTNTGTGTGTATVGEATPWTVAADVAVGDLFPGVGSNAVTVTVTNNGSGNQLLSQLVATIGAPTGTGTDGTIPACTAADFALSSDDSSWTITNGGLTATLPNIADDLAPTATHVATHLSVSMVNAATNQDNCQGATVNLSVAAS